MKQLLTQTYMEEMGFNNQPTSLQKTAKNKYQKSLDGDIDFFDVLGKPVIYSHKSHSYYTINESGELVNTTMPSRDDLEPLTNDAFSERFNIDGDKYVEKFRQNATLENQLQLILSPESVEKYFLELLESFSPEEKIKILQALELCKKYHAGQMRDEGVEYYSHPIFVAIKGIEYKSSIDDIIVLLLHDTIEDTELSYEEIEGKFGEKVAQGVKGMSKNEYSSEEEYYEAISNDESLAYYKGLDRLANIYSLNFSDTAKRERYIKATQEVVLPIVEKYHPELAEEIREVLEYLKAGNINSLPREVQSRLQDLQKISEIRGGLEE